MNITILIIFFIFQFTFLLFGRGPTIKFDSTEYDFGEVFRGERVSHSFKFKNVGDSVLIIRSVKPDCGCTLAVISNMTILPDKSSAIDINFNSDKFQGKIEKKILVFSNDEKNPEVHLKIKAEVISTRLIVVDFGEIDEKSARQKNIELYPFKETDLDSIRLTNSSDFILAKIDKKIKGTEQKYELTVSIMSNASSGFFSESIKIFCGEKNFDIKVMGKLLSDIIVLPPYLNWEVPYRSRVKPRIIKLYSKSNKQFNIQKIERSSSYLIIEEPEYKNRTNYEIMVKIKPSIQLGKTSGNIFVYTDNKKDFIIKIPFEIKVIK